MVTINDSKSIVKVYLFYRYAKYDGKIEFLEFYDKSITEESYNSYESTFNAAKIDYIDLYEHMNMKGEIDFSRVKNG